MTANCLSREDDMKNSALPEHPQPRTKPAEVRLDELMDAAQQLFTRKGFEAATVSDIVRDAGVAKGTFYHYFASKNEMLDALRERFTRQFIATLQQAVDSCAAGDSIGRLRAWCHAGVAAYLQGMELHDMLYHDHHYHTRGNRDRDAVLHQIVTILNQGQEAGHWYSDDLQLTAILIYHGMHGAVDNIVVSDQQQAEQLGEALTQQFMRLLGCQPE